MGRPKSPVELARVFHDRGVAAYTWGLVDGLPQTRCSWMSWYRAGRPGAVWFHDLLHPDGRPDDEAEAALLRSLSPRSTRPGT